MSRAISAFALTVAYWAGVAAFAGASVEPAAWLSLYAVCVTCALVLWANWPAALAAWSWLAVAGYCCLFAAIFFGADGALDALHGANRVKAQVAQSLGGLEFWFVLLPGVASVALASALEAFLGRSSCSVGAQTPEAAARRHAVTPTPGSNPGIERTSSGRLRLPPAAAHVER